MKLSLVYNFTIEKETYLFKHTQSADHKMLAK